MYPYLQGVCNVPCLALKASVANERSGKLDFSHQPLATTAGRIFPLYRFINHLRLLKYVYRFVVAHSLKEQSADAQFSLLHKNFQLWNKMAVLYFIDIVAFNCALCNFIGHLTFWTRKGLVTRKFEIKPPGILHLGIWMAVCEITFCPENRVLISHSSHRVHINCQAMVQHSQFTSCCKHLHS